MLTHLYQKGCPVPNGFVIMPTAFLGDEMLPQSWTRVQAYLGQMRRARAGISFAIRSSALGEDSITASFAGQYDTILAVRTDEEVRQAVQDVRRSCSGEGVLAYCVARGIIFR